MRPAPLELWLIAPYVSSDTTATRPQMRAKPRVQIITTQMQPRGLVLSATQPVKPAMVLSLQTA